MKIAIVSPGSTFTTEYVISLTNTLAWANAARHQIMYSVGESSSIRAARYRSLDVNPYRPGKVILNGAKPDRILMIDSDIQWTPEDVGKLLASPHSVVCGVYRNASYHGAGLAYSVDGVTPGTVEHLDSQHGPFKVGYGNLGFCAIKPGVFGKFSNWFHPRGDWLAEDHGFYAGLAEAGISAYVEPDVRVGHRKMETLTV
jgi:hypothetical protein